MQKSEDSQLWFENQEWLLSSISKAFQGDDMIDDSSLSKSSQSSCKMNQFASKQLQFCHLQNKIISLERIIKSTNLQLKVFGISGSITKKEPQLSCHKLEFFDSCTKNKINDVSLKDHMFDIEVNENDDSLICIKFKKIITSNLQRGSNYFGDNYIAAFKSPLVITDIFVGVFEQEQECLKFWKVNVRENARQVSWHPQSDSHLNILGSTCEQSKLLDQKNVKDQHFYVFNCSNSMIMAEIDINLSQSIEQQKKQSKIKHQFVSFNIQKQSLTYMDQGILTLYLLTQTGKIYYISPLLVSNQMIPSNYYEYVNTLAQKENSEDQFIYKIFEKRVFKNEKGCYYVKYSSSQQDDFKQVRVRIFKLKIRKDPTLKPSDYFYIHKISFTKYHIFLLGRKEIQSGNLTMNVVMTCNQLSNSSLEPYNQSSSQNKKLAFEIYSNQILANTLPSKEKPSEKKIENNNKLLIQTIQPNLLYKKMSFKSREELMDKYVNLKDELKSIFLKNFLVEYMTYKSALIVIDLSSIYKFEIKNNPNNLNISIKCVYLENEEDKNNVDYTVKDAELIGNFEPQALMFKINCQDNNIFTMSPENLNSFTTQEIDFIGQNVLDQAPVSKEITIKYRHISNRLTKLRQQLIQSREQIQNMDEHEPNFEKDCEAQLGQISNFISTDLVQIQTQVQNVCEEAVLQMGINQDLLEELSESKEDMLNKCNILKQNNQQIYKQLTLIENGDVSSQRGQQQLIYDCLNRDAQTALQKINRIREEYEQQIQSFSDQVDPKNLTKQQADDLNHFLKEKLGKMYKLLNEEIVEIEKRQKL